MGLPPRTTGVWLTYDFRRTLEAARADAARHARGGCGRGRLGTRRTRLLAIAREQSADFEGRLRFTYFSGLPVADVRARLAALPPDAVVIFTLISRDGAGVPFLGTSGFDAVAPSPAPPSTASGTRTSAVGRWAGRW